MSLYTKGNYKKIDLNFLSQGDEVLKEVSKVQECFGKPDTDTFINELRDSMAGYYLGYKLVNLEKHGFDCKLSETENIFLEVKSVSFTAKTWQATFNDTNMEKAECFKNNNVFLCLAVWKYASDLLFLVYGQNKKLGEYLENRVNSFLSHEAGVRSTQSINITDLIFKYKFDVVCVNRSKSEVLEMLRLKNHAFINIDENKLLTVAEFNKKYSVD